MLQKMETIQSRHVYLGPKAAGSWSVCQDLAGPAWTIPHPLSCFISYVSYIDLFHEYISLRNKQAFMQHPGTTRCSVLMCQGEAGQGRGPAVGRLFLVCAAGPASSTAQLPPTSTSPDFPKVPPASGCFPPLLLPNQCEAESSRKDFHLNASRLITLEK